MRLKAKKFLLSAAVMTKNLSFLIYANVLIFSGFPQRKNAQTQERILKKQKIGWIT